MPFPTNGNERKIKVPIIVIGVTNFLVEFHVHFWVFGFYGKFELK